MKKHLRLPTQRTRLKLSAGFFVLALIFLWLTAGAPMPLPILAHYKAAAEYGMDAGAVVAGGTVRFQSGAANTKGGDQGLRWRVRACADDYFVTTHSRVGGIFWSDEHAYPVWPFEETPIPVVTLAWGSDYIWEETHADGEWQYEAVNLVYVKLPDVARVELIMGMYPRDGNDDLSQYDWLLAHGVSADCIEAAPGTGLWLGQQIFPSPKGGGGSATLVRAYDADGTLLYESPVPGAPGFDG